MNTSTLLDLLSHTTLKGAAVLLVALLLGLALRRMAAARRYALWITAIATLAVLPLAMWALPAWHVLPQTDVSLEWPAMEPEPVIASAAPVLPPEDLPVMVPTASPVMPVSSQIVTPPSVSWNISWQDLVGALPVVWVLMTSLLLLRLGLSAWRLRRLEASLRPGECALLIQAAHDLGLQRLPRLLIGPSDSVPMVWGVLKPRLLLPSGFETWSPEKQRGVLLHELAHLKRGDPLALWAAQWVKALHWFNPLVWLTFRQLRADQERACDDAVLRHGVRASDYAQSLLDLSRHNRLAPGLSLCALTITRCAPVEARVKAILDPTLRREGLTLRWLAGLSACALLITLPMAMLHAIEGPPLRGRILDRNGVVVAESTKEKVRVYPFKTLAAHMLGYTRTADETHTQVFGGAGLEKQQDAELTAGNNVTLTLDMRMQSLVNRAMMEAGVTRGAAVVLDPRTGEILAAVSLPSFDPNLFIPSISKENWDQYLSNRDVPLLNRCVKGYVPGSTFKLLTGLAGGAAGISGQKFNCTGSVTYGNKAMQCWFNRQNGGGHGVLGMRDALVMSCGCYWYQFGNAAGIDQIDNMGRKIGFGSTYGISDDESPGILPSPAWLKDHHPKETWSNGYTAITSIGQGLLLATPLQMAVLAATVGNLGKVPQPAIVKSSGARTWRADLTQDTLSAADVEPLREGMRMVVNGESGTGKPARSDQVMIAGKTGTVQNWRIDANKNRVDDNLGWFVGFAPYENPQFAFAIVKNGVKSGGSDCAPIAKRIVEEALALPADGSGEVTPVEEKSLEAHTRSDFRAAPKPPQIFKKTPAKVISQNPSASSNSLVIDKGSLDGIVANSPVITSVGVVGKTATPEPHTTKVILLTDELCRVSAKVEGTLEQGILAGERAAQVVQPQLHLRFLSRFAEINVGASVYSSGEGGVFPADLLLGRVKQFKSGDVSGEAMVEPAVDFSTLDQVLVMELKTEYPAQEAPTPPKPADQAQLRQQDDAEIRMKRELADQWTALKKSGLLADLPAGVWMFDLGKNEERRVKSAPEFHFSALREAGHRWLLSSLNSSKNTYDSSLKWPDPPESFHRTYAAADHCMITVHSSDGKHLHIIVSQQKPSILIAPDYSPAMDVAPQTQRPQTPATDADLIMDPQLASQWRLLRRKGFLADLPAEAVLPAKPDSPESAGGIFLFTAPREAAQRWLSESLGETLRKHYEKQQPWPEKPGTFDYTYEGLGDCMMHLASLNADKVEVRVWRKQPKSILIAPDEAAPPTPKTAAPKELSGAVSNETQPMVDAGQKKLEFDAEEMSRQIRLLANKTGVSLREFKMGDGRLSLIGLSKNLDEARMFGDLLTQNGRQWGIAWHLTPPQNVPDRPLTMLMAVGSYPTASISAAMSSPPPSGITSPPNMSVSAVGGVVSPLSNWRTLQQFGKLADLPADYAPERITPAESLTGPIPSVMYAFTASRKAVHAWLSASLPSKSLAAQTIQLRELAETEPFEHDFWGRDLSRLRVVCAGNKARVLISRMTRIFQIAPDESKKPRPAGKLAPDYRQDALTSAEPGLPTLDPTLQTLRSVISPEEEKRLPWFLLAAPIQYNLQASNLPSDPKDEEEALLHNSRTARNRAQQALLVRPPQMQ